MKKLLFIAAAIFLLPFIGMKGTPAGNPSASPSRAANSSSKASSQSGYISPTPGHFPIIALSPTYKDNFSRNSFRKLMDCGFNCAVVGYDSETFLDLLQNLKDTDSITFINDRAWYYGQGLNSGSDEYIRQDTDEINNLYEKMNLQGYRRSFIGGFRVKDEPSYDQIPYLARHHAAISKADPTVMPIVNLVGTYVQGIDSAQNQQDKTTDPYERRRRFSHFLNKFYEEVNPRVWSYDFYPFAYYNSSDSVEVRLDHFYYALATFAGLSKRTGIPFWAYCQSTRDSLIDKGKPGEYGGHPEATEERLRFEAFNALAMGAKGICYWRYAQQDPVIRDLSEEYYLQSLTDKNDNRMPGWNAARKVNSEIKRHEQLFLRTELQSYSFMGDTSYAKPPEAADIPEYDGHIGIRMHSGPGILVSNLKDGESNVTFIVNQSVTDTAKFTIYYGTKPSMLFMFETEHVDTVQSWFTVKPLNSSASPEKSGISINPPNPPIGPPLSKDTICPFVIEHLLLAPSGYLIIKYIDVITSNPEIDYTSDNSGHGDGSMNYKLVSEAVLPKDL